MINATNPYANNLYNYKDQHSKGSNIIIEDEFGAAETSHFNKGEMSKMQNTLSPIEDEMEDDIFNDPREAHYAQVVNANEMQLKTFNDEERREHERI